jgi:hypothetical protein
MRPGIVCNRVLFMRPGRVPFMRTDTVHNRWTRFITPILYVMYSDM